MCHEHDPTYSPDSDPAIRYCWAYEGIYMELDGEPQPSGYRSLFQGAAIIVGEEAEAEIDQILLYMEDGNHESSDNPVYGIQGFHMLRTEKEAVEYKNRLLWDLKRNCNELPYGGYSSHLKLNIIKQRSRIKKRAILLKCEVRGFLSGGEILESYYGQGTFSETWRYRTLVEEVEL